MDPVKIFEEELKKKEKCMQQNLLKNLEERSLGCPKKNVTLKEQRELIAEELLVEKEKFDELVSSSELRYFQLYIFAFDVLV